MKQTNIESLLLPQDKRHRLTRRVALWCLGVLCGGASVYALPVVIKPGPVVQNMRGRMIRNNPPTYQMQVTGEKVRDCQIASGSVTGWAKNGTWRITGFHFIGQPDPERYVYRPPGHQDFGLWQWSIKPDDVEVKLILKHICDGETVFTTVGPFYIHSNLNNL